MLRSSSTASGKGPGFTISRTGMPPAKAVVVEEKKAIVKVKVRGSENENRVIVGNSGIVF